MLNLLWHLSAAIRGYLRYYTPTNIAIDLLRTRRGLKWAVPVALVAIPVYLYAVSLCAVIVADGGPGWINVLVLLFFWNAVKFGLMAALSPFLLLRRIIILGTARRKSARPHASVSGTTSTPPAPATSGPTLESLPARTGP